VSELTMKHRFFSVRMMRTDPIHLDNSTTQEPGRVSGRFLSDFFASLERNHIPAKQLLGDLPIPIGESGRVTRSIEWNDFAALMKRLEHHLGGPDELERCGELVGELKPMRALQSLLGSSASPYMLYRAASRWALRRAMPGIETHIEETRPNHIEIRVRLVDGLRACPQIFHFATGGARALPRILGLSDAVVTAEVSDFEAHYQIVVPPSQTLWARFVRFYRVLFSSGSLLQFLENQQLELNAKHGALQKAHSDLAKSEQRYRAIADAAADILCEIDEHGRITYVSASVEELTGYTPGQVTGSHFSLWVPADRRDQAKKRFESFGSQSLERSIIRERLKLQTEAGKRIIVEVSLRSYRTPDDALRMVGTLREETQRPKQSSREGPARGEQNELDSLRSSLSIALDSTSGHPIKHSLAALLDSLDTHSLNPSEQRTNQLVAATERMTRIVESTMHQDSESASTLRWFETKKLTDQVEFEFLMRRAERSGPGPTLKIDASLGPAMICCEENLLAGCLASLIDWTAERTASDGELALWIHEAVGDQDANTTKAVFFVSSRRAKHSDTQNSDRASAGESRGAIEMPSALTIANAEDSANALGGDLTLTPDQSPRPVCQLQIPQPKRIG
jgi:PAS domain S-box-containing protein